MNDLIWKYIRTQLSWSELEGTIGPDLPFYCSARIYFISKASLFFLALKARRCSALSTFVVSVQCFIWKGGKGKIWITWSLSLFFLLLPLSAACSPYAGPQPGIANTCHPSCKNNSTYQSDRLPFLKSLLRPVLHNPSGYLPCYCYLIHDTNSSSSSSSIYILLSSHNWFHGEQRRLQSCVTD